jgi:hypothetical protein
MEESVKIAKIKKSCNVGKKISNIFFILAIIGCIAALAGSIVIFSMGSDFDTEIQKGIEAGYITEGDDFGASSWVNINVGDVSKLHSDVPAIQNAIDDHPYAITYGSYCMIGAVACVVIAVLMKMISSVFALIIKEDTPFTDKVIKRVVVIMIAISACMLLTTGAAFAALGAITTWVVYSIMDYGKTLQIQSDETL